MQTFAAFEDAAKVVVCFRAGRAILPAKASSEIIQDHQEHTHHLEDVCDMPSGFET
jgi:hypothetical protein